MNEIHIRPKANRKWDIVLQQHSEFLPSQNRLLEVANGREAAVKVGHQFGEKHLARVVYHPSDDERITSEYVIEDYTR